MSSIKLNVRHIVNFSYPNFGRREKRDLHFCFHTFLQFVIKPFEAPKRSVKIKISVLIQLSEMYRAGRVNSTRLHFPKGKYVFKANY